jgi:TolA-binding protein
VLEAGDDWVRGSPAVAATPGTASRTAAPSPSRAAGSPAVAATPGTASRTAAPSPSRAAGARVDLAASEQRRLGDSTDVHAGRSAAAARASFERAWSLLRQGNPMDAAKLFAEVETLAQGAGIAEDALYWRAVAITRTRDVPEARRIFGDFLGRFPASVHHGEAATALGWLLLDGGDADAARRAFAQAIDDPSRTVRDSARDGLARASRP